MINFLQIGQFISISANACQHSRLEQLKQIRLYWRTTHYHAYFSPFYFN